MSRVEERLFAGAVLMKTMDQDAPMGCFWTFQDGLSARADICEKMLADGFLVQQDEGLFPGTGQLYRLAPYEGDFEQFIAERFGPDWHVCDRITPTLKKTHKTLIRRQEYVAARREYDARRRAA